MMGKIGLNQSFIYKRPFPRPHYGPKFLNFSLFNTVPKRIFYVEKEYGDAFATASLSPLPQVKLVICTVYLSGN